MVSQDVARYWQTVPNDVIVTERIERQSGVAASLIHDVIFGVIIFCVPILLLGILKGIAVQEEYAMQKMRNDVIQLLKENEVTKLEVAKLDAPARIQIIAEKELGMKVPATAIYGSKDIVYGKKS